MNDLEKLMIQFLKLNKGSIHPGKGVQNARLTRDVCELLGLDEDEFLPRFVMNNKGKWGLGDDA